MTDLTTEIGQAEFVERFVAHMLKVGGQKFDDGTSIEEYARMTGPTYWEDEEQRSWGPEECADADMSYWGEE